MTPGPRRSSATRARCGCGRTSTTGTGRAWNSPGTRCAANSTARRTGRGTSPQWRSIGRRRARPRGRSRCGACARMAAAENSAIRSSRRGPIGSPTYCARSAQARALASSCWRRAGAELYETVLGALKANGVVVGTVHGVRPRAAEDAICDRLGRGAGDDHRRCIAARSRRLRGELPTAAQGDPARRRPDGPGAIADTARTKTLMEAASETFAAPATAAETPALLHFTSGTTGTPKGALHVHDAALMHFMTGRLCAGPACRRRLLVHRRSRLGHGNVLRRHRAAAAWRHLHRLRGRIRCGALVPDP